jgi:hypothetical protein
MPPCRRTCSTTSMNMSHSAQFIQVIMNELGLGVLRTYLRAPCRTSAWCSERLLLGKAAQGSRRHPCAQCVTSPTCQVGFYFLTRRRQRRAAKSTIKHCYTQQLDSLG